MSDISFQLRRPDRSGSGLRPITESDHFATDSALRSNYEYTIPPKSSIETHLVSDTIGYDTVALSFFPANVPPDSTYGAAVQFSIVRSPAGFPTTQLDGTGLARYDPSYSTLPPNGLFLVYDRGLTSGQWYYYVLFAKFVYLGVTYNLEVARSDVLVPVDFGYRDRLWDLVPEYYRRLDNEQGSRIKGGPYRRFIETVGYEVDIQRTYALTVGDLWDVKRVSARLLTPLAAVLGKSSEDAAGDKRMRTLLSNLIYLRKIKGSKDGIEGYLAAITGYRTLVYEGKNLYLTNDGTEQRTSLGLWQAPATTVATVSNKALTTNVATLTTAAAHGFLTGDTVVVAGVDAVFNGTVVLTGAPTTTTFTYAKTNANITSVASGGTVTRTNATLSRITSAGEASGPAVGQFYARLTNSTGAQTAGVLTYGATPFDPRAAIPVTAGHQYRSSYMAISSAASKSIIPSIDWYSIAGVLLSSTNDTALNTNTTWSSFNSAWLTAPANAVFAVPRFTTNVMANAATMGLWKFMLTDRTWQTQGVPQLAGADPSTTYESGRMAYINLYPQRLNLAINSDFRVATSGWTATEPSTYDLIPVAYSTYSALLSGESTYADLLAGLNPLVTTTTLAFDTTNHWLTIDTSTTATPWLAQVTSDFFPVYSIGTYSARVEALSVAGTGSNLLLRMRWYTAANTGAEILGTVVSSIAYPLSTVNWTSCSIGNCQPPPNALFGRLVVETSNPTTDHTDRIRRVLIEDAPVPGLYFDGSFTEGNTGDFMFTGSPWTSYSVYYQNYFAMLHGNNNSDRVHTILPSLLPPDREYTLLTATTGLL